MIALVWTSCVFAFVAVVANRRFNRSRVDAERAVSAFTGRLRDEVDLDELGAAITATVSGTVQPVSVSLWLRA